ncbi:MAG: hypothetical protein M3N23_06890, partial [Pseudomonadota bacterium]|nr:hypothetical protein [Pseudomonadota bacterium]
VLAQTENCTTDALRRKAWMALEAVAHAGIGEAQWLMAELIGQSNASDSKDGAAAANHAFLTPIRKLPTSGRADQAVLDWTIRAADAGVSHAQRSLADHAWDAGNHDGFLHWALPIGRQILQQRTLRPAGVGEVDANVERADVTLLARCTQVLLARGAYEAPDLEAMLEAAAHGGDPQASLSLGLWYARMTPQGGRLGSVRGLANYRKSLRWLIFAGEHGLPGAWFAISRIYLKPEFSQRNVSDAQYYVLKAADAGHADAQFELATNAWRGRRTDLSKDIEAAYWLRKAAASQHAEAIELLEKVADRPAPGKWAIALRQRLTRDQINTFPLLVARLDLAAEFGLSRAESLLLNLQAADCGHCLLVDIRDVHPRSKRRLILLQSNEQRHLLNRVLRLFDDVDTGMEGPEGNYRQRMYRLRMLMK